MKTFKAKISRLQNRKYLAKCIECRAFGTGNTESEAIMDLTTSIAREVGGDFKVEW